MSVDARVAFPAKSLPDFLYGLRLFSELEGSRDDTDAVHTR